MRFFISSLALCACLACGLPAGAVDFDVDRNLNFQLGRRDFGPVNVPDGFKRCGIRIDRTNWTNPAAKLKAWLEVSVGGGAFRGWMGVTDEGGPPMKAHDGITDRETFIESALPAGINRKVQGYYEVSGARFRATVYIRCF